MLNLPLRVRVVAGLAGLVLVADLLAIGIKSATGAFEPGYEVTATFPESGTGLSDHSDVRIRGVTVGAVEAVDASDDGRAVVTMKLRPDVRLPVETTASIEPLSIFGPQFVSLDLGDRPDRGPFLAAGDAIGQTAAPTELQDMLAQVSELFEAVDTGELLTIVETTAEGLRGTGPALADAIDSADRVFGVLARRAPETATFLTDAATLSTTFEDRGDEMVAIARDLTATAPVLRQNEDRFAELLDATARLSGDLADVLDAEADSLAALLEGLDTLSVPLLEHVDLIPEYLGALEDFFGTLGRVARIDHEGPGVSAALEGVMPQSLCDVFLVLGCSGEGAP